MGSSFIGAGDESNQGQSSLSMPKEAAVVGTVIGLLRRAAGWHKNDVVLVVLVILINTIDSFDTRQGWGRVGGGRMHVVVMGFSDKVAMVMMTLLAFLHRKARRLRTREFLSA